MTCRLRQRNGNQLDIQIDRGGVPLGPVIVVDLDNGMAMEARLISSKGQDVRLEIQGCHNLKGLVPARLGRAREVWKRARP